MRLALTIILLALLLFAATWEQVFIRNAYEKLESDVNAFYAVIKGQIERDENIDTAENIAAIEDIQKYWLKKEKSLCFFARHFDLNQISDALIYAMNFTRFNIPEEAAAGIERVKYLIDTREYNVGISMQNVI